MTYLPKMINPKVSDKDILPELSPYGYNYAELKDEKYKLRTNSLFIEFIGPAAHKKFDPPFTIDEKDKGKYLSLKKIYLEFGDITEVEFAKTVFGSFAHWERLCGAFCFKKHISQWRKELELSLVSKAVKKIEEIAASNSKDALQAAKWLGERKWRQAKPKKPVGRPEGSEYVSPKKQPAPEKDSDITKDAERMGLPIAYNKAG